MSYADLDSGEVSGGRLTSPTVGVNWYLNRWLKLVLNYDRTWFDGGARGSTLGNPIADRETEHFVATRLQFSY